ncbi:MAG: hypothetical protein ACOYLB_15880 [Phototrophicaceae bacterium]
MWKAKKLDRHIMEFRPQQPNHSFDNLFWTELRWRLVNTLNPSTHPTFLIINVSGFDDLEMNLIRAIVFSDELWNHPSLGMAFFTSENPHPYHRSWLKMLSVAQERTQITKLQTTQSVNEAQECVDVVLRYLSDRTTTTTQTLRITHV